MTQRKPAEDFLFTHQVMVGSAFRFGIGRGGGLMFRSLGGYDGPNRSGGPGPGA